METRLRGNEANIIARLRYTPPENDDLVKDKTDYYALNYRIKKQTSISTKIGLELYKSFNYLLVEGLWRGLHDGWKQIKRLPEDLITDFQNQEEKPEILLSELKKELLQIQKQENEILGCDLVLMTILQGQNPEEQIARFRARSPEQSEAPVLIKQGTKFSIYGYLNGAWRLTHLSDGDKVFGQLIFSEEGKLIKKGDYLLTPTINLSLKRGHDLDRQAAPRQLEEKGEEPTYAQPEIPLLPYNSHGVLNGGVTGFNEFVDLFGHNMFAKHPFTATVSTGGAAVSFLAFFATPLAVKLLGKAYVKFLQDQGYIWTKDLFSASMAGSFTNFKLIGAVIEGIEHGPDSWLSKGISHILNDPAKAITYTTLAWVIGYSLVYLVNIPGLSEELKKHIGDPPQLSEIFGGAKLGIIAYHLFSSPHGSTELARKNYLDECFQNYLDSEKKRGREVSAEKAEQVRACLEKLVSAQAVDRLRAQVQEAQALPQTAQEKDLALMFHLSLNKEKLAQLSPLLKAKLQRRVESLASSKEDARAIEQYIDPEKHASKSTLRSFLGRTISYAPTLIRCVLSPFAGLVTRSSISAFRPWKELGEMLLDDLTSTAHAASRFMNKILETCFNRIPRTLADIFINGMLARTASFFGFHKFAMAGYRQSANWDIQQEELYANTTGRVLNYLALKNTAPNPEISLKYALNERMQASFSANPVPIQVPAADIELSERSCLSVYRR